MGSEMCIRDSTLPDGRLWFLSPGIVARLIGAGLLAGHMAKREPDPVGAAECAAVFCGAGDAHPCQSGDPDPLRDGLLRGCRDDRDASPEKT